MYCSIRPLKNLLLPIKSLHKKKVGRFAPRMRLNAPDPPSGSPGGQALVVFPPTKSFSALAEWGRPGRRGLSTECSLFLHPKLEPKLKKSILHFVLEALNSTYRFLVNFGPIFRWFGALFWDDFCIIWYQFFLKLETKLWRGSATNHASEKPALTH